MLYRYEVVSDVSFACVAADIDRRSEIFYRRSFSGESRPETGEQQEIAPTESEERRESTELVDERYEQFEQAFHKRMMIRDLKV